MQAGPVGTTRRVDGDDGGGPRGEADYPDGARGGRPDEPVVDEPEHAAVRGRRHGPEGNATASPNVGARQVGGPCSVENLMGVGMP